MHEQEAPLSCDEDDALHIDIVEAGDETGRVVAEVSVVLRRPWRTGTVFSRVRL
ncbi:MAG: hypothetical protein ACI8S6_000555 [Myxococcota bacterium]|jgi:hypothetical protein